MAERPETLQGLQQDQAELHRSLNQAGVLEEGRTISFHIGGSQTTMGGTRDGGSFSGSGSSYSETPSGQPQGTNSHANGDGQGYAAQEHGGYRGGRRPAQQSTAIIHEDEPLSPSWLRAGLDITA